MHRISRKRMGNYKLHTPILLFHVLQPVHWPLNSRWFRMRTKNWAQINIRRWRDYIKRLSHHPSTIREPFTFKGAIFITLIPSHRLLGRIRWLLCQLYMRISPENELFDQDTFGVHNAFKPSLYPHTIWLKCNCNVSIERWANGVHASKTLLLCTYSIRRF